MLAVPEIWALAPLASKQNKSVAAPRTAEVSRRWRCACTARHRASAGACAHCPCHGCTGIDDCALVGRRDGCFRGSQGYADLLRRLVWSKLNQQRDKTCDLRSGERRTAHHAPALSGKGCRNILTWCHEDRWR